MAVRMKRLVLVVFLLCSCLSVVSSLFFYLEEGERRCFIQEIPEDTNVIGDYRTQLSEEELMTSQDSSLFIEAKDPENLALRLRFISKGSFFFTSVKPGEHQICLQPTPLERPLSADRLLEVHLNIRVGERTNNYTAIAATEGLSRLRLRVRQLKEQLLQIQKEQNYYMVRAKAFKQINHNIDMWIFWWSVARSLSVVAFIMCVTNTW